MRRACAEELQALSDYIASHQRERESRIAYFGTTPAEIAAEIEEWGRAWPQQLLVAEEDGVVVGLVGADIDTELGRAWLHGPFVEPAAWDPLGGRLLAQIIAEIVPRDVRDLELAGDVANRRLSDLAAEEGFVRGAVSYALEIGREAASRFPPADMPNLERQQHADFITLHDTLFPGTYYSGRQLVDQQERGEALVLTLRDDGGLVGYAAGRVDATGEGYLDFVGVAERGRSRGRGTELVIGFCRALFADPRPSKVALTVRDDNAAALTLYRRLGFQEVASLVGYRRQPPDETGLSR